MDASTSATIIYYVNGKSVDRSLRTRNERVARDSKKKLDAADIVGQLDEPSTTPIEVVVQDYCQYLLDRVVEDGLKPKTVNRLREVLRGLFNFALEHKGYVCPDRRYRNPVEGVRRHREMAPVITWLKTDDIQKQLQVLDQTPILHVMGATFIFAALRREDAMWFTTPGVDLDGRLLPVRAKTFRGEAWQPKTRRNRVVPIGEALLSVLRNYEAPANRSWFFLSPGGTRWHPDNFSAALRQANEPHGLSWSCLDYRHTFGSHLAQRGMSLFNDADDVDYGEVTISWAATNHQ